MSDPETFEAAAKALEWALGQIEMDNTRLIQLGDPPAMVCSEKQMQGMVWATNIMLLCKHKGPTT